MLNKDLPTSKDNSLRNCPFCGDEASQYDSDGQSMDDWAQCYCSALDGRSIHASHWNTRPIEDALRAENGKQQEHIADLYAAIRQDGEERGTVIFERNLLQLEVNKLKARVEAAEELIEALDDDIRIHRDEMSNIKRANPYADAICQHLVLKVQPAKNKWEALK